MSTQVEHTKAIVCKNVNTSYTTIFFNNTFVHEQKNWKYRVIFFLLEAGFGSIVMVYLQTYKLCILTLLCRSTVLWLSPFGNFGYILFIFWTYYLGFQILAFRRTSPNKPYVLKENCPCRNQGQHMWNTQKP
jgi:hypothetical protein